MESYRSAAQLLLDALEQPIVVIETAKGESSARVILATTAATNILRLHHSKHTSEGSMSADAETIKSLAKSALKAMSDGSHICWRTPKGDRYRIHAKRGTRNTVLIRMVATSFYVGQTKRAAPLTSREVEVLKLMARGFIDKEISKAMNCSYHTTRAHIRNIYEKLGVSNKIEALNKWDNVQSTLPQNRRLTPLL
jgi:DNA-binding CsgD family transcriptional regulator